MTNAKRTPFHDSAMKFVDNLSQEERSSMSKPGKRFTTLSKAVEYTLANKIHPVCVFKTAFHHHLPIFKPFCDEGGLFPKEQVSLLVFDNDRLGREVLATFLCHTVILEHRCDVCASTATNEESTSPTPAALSHALIISGTATPSDVFDHLLEQLVLSCGRDRVDDAIEAVRNHVSTIDLTDVDFPQLVTGAGSSAEANTDEADKIIELIRGGTKWKARTKVIVIDAPSFLTRSEDNQSFRRLFSSIKRIARELELTILILAHSTQNLDEKLKNLQLRIHDIQSFAPFAQHVDECVFAAELGGDRARVPDETDARAILHSCICSHRDERAVALLPLKSNRLSELSFLKEMASYGLASTLEAIQTPDWLKGKSLSRVEDEIHQKQIEIKDAKSRNASQAGLEEIRAAVARLHGRDVPVTDTSVAKEANTSREYAGRMLAKDAREGMIQFTDVKKNGKYTRTTYSPNSSLAPTQGQLDFMQKPEESEDAEPSE